MLWNNPGEIPGNGIDDDGNGYVDDVHGISLANAPEPGQSSADGAVDEDYGVRHFGHGTHCGGTIL